ncbi:MAG TPA: hypothetical protein VK469_19620 [Candidatus Kapabacteria bacterium]|nr:hypothetical protein [Candidatus Kapabacteria bacterium]
MKICKPKQLSESTYKMYKEMIFNSVLEGWATIWPKMSQGAIIEGYYNEKYGLCQDKMWAQGFYGTFLALDWRKTKDPRTLGYTIDFVKAIETMLSRTNGIYLRDNTKKASDMYKSLQDDKFIQDQKNLEISRDQIIGLTAALYMIYCYVDESAAPKPSDKKNILSLKKRITKLFTNLQGMFKRHESLFNYPLYNELKNRELGNYPDCWTFKPPLQLAFNRVQGAGTGAGQEEEINLANLISHIMKMGTLADRVWETSQSVDGISALGNSVNKSNILKVPYFNWNLVMYFLLIAGLENKKWAKVAVSFIDTFISLGYKHMNLSAVYCCLVKKWQLNASLEENGAILSHDTYLFPDTIIPCSLAEPDQAKPDRGPTIWGSYWPSPTNPPWWWRFDSVCQDPPDVNENWCTPPPPPQKTLDDIKEESKNQVIEIDCGLTLLFRHLLYNF